MFPAEQENSLLRTQGEQVTFIDHPFYPERFRENLGEILRGVAHSSHAPNQGFYKRSKAKKFINHQPLQESRTVWQTMCPQYKHMSS